MRFDPRFDARHPALTEYWAERRRLANRRWASGRELHRCRPGRPCAARHTSQRQANSCPANRPTTTVSGAAGSRTSTPQGVRVPSAPQSHGARTTS